MAEKPKKTEKRKINKKGVKSNFNINKNFGIKWNE